MGGRIGQVLDTYHEMIEAERNSPRELPPGGRDGGQDQRLRAVGRETGQFINILAKSPKAPTILELSGPGVSTVRRLDDLTLITAHFYFCMRHQR